LLIFNFISSQSTFAMFVMLILNVFMNLLWTIWKDISFVLEVSCQVEYVFFLWHFNHYKM
jgi:hypothetical protein